MYIVDDPTLALLTRFVGESCDHGLSDAEFFRRQIAAITEYVEAFPAHEHEERALAWIEANARRYRQQWQKHAAVDILARTRCPDCPLAGGKERHPCAIHTRWLKLLQRYAADELSSHQYVESSLTLLRAHKDLLRVSRLHASLRSLPSTTFCRG